MIEKKFMRDAMKRSRTKDYLKQELKRVGIVDVDIQRTTLATRISLTAERPGLIIGRKGKNIQQLTETLENKMGIENPKIEVNDVKTPNLEPGIIAREIAELLEKGHKPKKIMQREISKVMSAGAIGCEILLGGTWRKGIKARSERVSKGYMKKAGYSTRFVKVAHDEAILKQGKIGIKVSIVPPGVVFPDKVDIEKAMSLKYGGEKEVKGPETAEPARAQGNAGESAE